MSTLRFDHLSRHFQAVKAVDDLSLEIAHGELVCLLGPSGCGKSTALRMVAGFETPTSGDILVDSQSIVHLPPNKRPTAMVFQKYTLWPHMTVFKNIAFGLQLRQLSRNEVNQKVKESLEMVGLAGYEKRLPAQLSGGQQQRVAIARALVLEPKILLLDEPFSSLDAHLRVRLREELKRIQRRLNITTVFVTHDQEEALSLADRIAVLNMGRLEQFARPSELYAKPQSLFVAGFIGQMNILEGESDGQRIKLSDYEMNSPSGVTSGKVTLALRPEDISLLTNEIKGTWAGTVDTIMDLGAYQTVSIKLLPYDLKVMIDKTQRVAEGQKVWLRPDRFLVYQNERVTEETTSH